ncbi:MAG: FeoB-associated Cys-rich membrane protein [Verrucomicrobia bacterium]|nr:FeoB-associated Cys-rich membrane protein [Verrucomicrobiota bacterium]
MDWQTITALACVLGTLAVFAWRMFRPGESKSGCGGGCGCGNESKEPLPVPPIVKRH